jgi:hypothetical protein
MSKLAAKDPSETIRSELRDAYKLFMAKQRQRTPLVLLLKDLPYVNNKETVGITKAALEEHASKGTEQRDFVLAVMRWYRANDIESKEPEVFAVARPHFDETLATIYKDLKKDRVKMSSFWSIYRDLAAMVVPHQDVDALLAATGSWATYEGQLERVCSRSKLGKSMWEWAHAKVVVDKVRQFMEDFTQDLAALLVISVAAAQPLCKQVRDKTAARVGINLLPQRRVVSIAYRGTMCEHTVAGIDDELQRRIMAVAKGRAVQAGKLELLIFEDELVPSSFKYTHAGVDMDMMSGAKEARAAANSFITLESSAPDGNTAVRVLNIKERTLTAMDRGFQIEVAWMTGMAGGAGQTMLMDRVKKCLPSEAKSRTTDQTLSELSALFATSLYAFPSKQAQQGANVIRQAVTSIHLKRRPLPLEPTSAPDLKAAYEQLAYFCKATDDSTGASVDVFGKAAVDVLYEQCRQNIEAKLAYTMADLSFGRFHWLLSTSQADQMKQWTQAKLPNWDGDVEGMTAEDKDVQAKHKKAKLADAELDKAVDDAFA